ncbi:MAG: hypothetical protein KC502_06170 [Myxococcales bacterium]|nr:hypothetical protein [Myxococcales bacterium]
MKRNPAQNDRTCERKALLRLLICAFVMAMLAGCKSPCEQLADRLCTARGVKMDKCTEWQTRTGRVSPETCEHALRMLDRERIR